MSVDGNAVIRQNILSTENAKKAARDVATSTS
jgi:hypothetical protein